MTKIAIESIQHSYKFILYKNKLYNYTSKIHELLRVDEDLKVDLLLRAIQRWPKIAHYRSVVVLEGGSHIPYVLETFFVSLTFTNAPVSSDLLIQLLKRYLKRRKIPFPCVRC